VRYHQLPTTNDLERLANLHRKLLAASFSTKVWHIVVTQGIEYGTGFLVLYCALLSMLNKWFVKRRGIAFDILLAAAGISGTVLPFLIQIVLNMNSFQRMRWQS